MKNIPLIMIAKSVFLFLMVSMPSLLLAQYKFVAKGGKILENNSSKPISTGMGNSLQFHTLTSYGFKIETVQYGFGGGIDLVNVEETTYGDLLLMVKNNPPEIKESKGNYYFYLTNRENELVYSAVYRTTSDVKVSKITTMTVHVKGNKKDAEDYLNMLIDKAKAVTSKAGYKDDRSSFTAFSALEKTINDKKVEDEINSLDLDLSTDEEKAAKASRDKQLREQQIASYKPIYFKKGGEIIFSIYYDKTTASSLNTKVYRGDKAKLLFTTYKDIYKGQLSKTAQFEKCNYCSIYSIIDVGSRVIPIKNKPNSIQYQMMFKDNYWYLIKGTGTNTEVDYNSNFEKLEICNTKDDGDIYGKCSLSIESEVKLNAKTKLWVIAMLHMSGYIADDGSFGE